MRREAQLILDNLYLGGYQSSRTVDGLDALGITHMSVLGLVLERCRDASLLAAAWTPPSPSSF